MRRINLFSYGMMSLLKLFARVLVIVLAVSLFQQAHSAQAVPVRPPHFDRRAMPEALAAPVRSPKGDAAKPAPDWRFYVLEYHNFTENASQAADYTMTVSALRRDLDFLRDNGYTTVLPRELAAGQLDDGSPLPQKAVLLTFDDGYDDNSTNLLPLLQKYGMKATIFLIAGDVGKRHKLTREQISELVQSGLVSIQSHGWSHRNMANLPPLELLLEMARSQSAIAALTGRPPTALSYPNGSSNERVRKIAGWFYTYGVRTYAGVYVTGRDPLLIERITVSRGTPLEAFKAACQTADVSE